MKNGGSGWVNTGYGFGATRRNGLLWFYEYNTGVRPTGKGPEDGVLANRRYLVPIRFDSTRELGDDKLKMWQYKMVPLRGTAPFEENEEILNSFGRQGWELVAMTEVSSFDLTAFLKRETRANA